MTSELFPAEYWELFELVLAECPETAVKAFRKSVIGRGKPINARTADCAIRAAKLYLYAYDKAEQIALRIKLDGVKPETGAAKVKRNEELYVANGWPVIFVRRAGEDWTTEVAEMRQGYDGPVSLLEFDDEHVDRIAG